MKITSVQLRTVQKEGSKIKAFADIVFDDELVVKDLRVIEGSNGLFVGMPSIKGSDGQYRDIAFPVTAGARQMISEAILTRYQESLEA